VSVSCFIVILAQSANTSRAYALRYRERFDENLDLVGLALANAAAACSGTFVVNGSPTKTAMVDTAGSRSQLSHLATATMVLLVLLFLTGPLSHLPNAVKHRAGFEVENAIGLTQADPGSLIRFSAPFTQQRYGT
jgi:sulfate permease, SulP family